MHVDSARGEREREGDNVEWTQIWGKVVRGVESSAVKKVIFMNAAIAISNDTETIIFIKLLYV